jgi:hypothetical protein
MPVALTDGDGAVLETLRLSRAALPVAADETSFHP